MLERIKTFDVDRLDLDELVALSAFGRSLRAEFEALGGEAPEWLDNQLRVLRREVKARQADTVEKKLREAKAKLSTLRTTEEKRADTLAEIERLEKLMAGQ